MVITIFVHLHSVRTSATGEMDFLQTHGAISADASILRVLKRSLQAGAGSCLLADEELSPWYVFRPRRSEVMTVPKIVVAVGG